MEDPIVVLTDDERLVFLLGLVLRELITEFGATGTLSISPRLFDTEVADSLDERRENAIVKGLEAPTMTSQTLCKFILFIRCCPTLTGCNLP